MKADIISPEVTNVVVAVVPRDNRTSEDLWDVYVVNLRKEPMENVLITSQGYGEIDGADKTTTVLRHFHQRILPGGYLKIEPIQRDLFSLKNEYWISFNDADQMLDKRYVFASGQIATDKLVEVPGLAKPGIFVR